MFLNLPIRFMVSLQAYWIKTLEAFYTPNNLLGFNISVVENICEIVHCIFAVGVSDKTLCAE